MGVAIYFKKYIAYTNLIEFRMITKKFINNNGKIKEEIIYGINSAGQLTGRIWILMPKQSKTLQSKRVRKSASLDKGLLGIFGVGAE